MIMMLMILFSCVHSLVDCLFYGVREGFSNHLNGDQCGWKIY